MADAADEILAAAQELGGGVGGDQVEGQLRDQLLDADGADAEGMLDRMRTEPPPTGQTESAIRYMGRISGAPLPANALDEPTLLALASAPMIVAELFRDGVLSEELVEQIQQIGTPTTGEADVAP